MNMGGEFSTGCPSPPLKHASECWRSCLLAAGLLPVENEYDSTKVDTEAVLYSIKGQLQKKKYPLVI